MKKMLSLTLALALVVAMLCGCGARLGGVQGSEIE